MVIWIIGLLRVKNYRIAVTIEKPRFGLRRPDCVISMTYPEGEGKTAPLHP